MIDQNPQDVLGTLFSDYSHLDVVGGPFMVGMSDNQTSDYVGERSVRFPILLIWVCTAMQPASRYRC